MQRNEEREAKFHIEVDAGAPDLTALPDGLRVSELDPLRLEARYYDTEDHDLLREGITLRHRRESTGAGDGEDLWTLKLPRRGEDLVTRSELSWPGAEADVPAETQRLLTAVLHGHRLGPVAAFVTVRTRHRIHDRDGRRLGEIDDDRVTVTAPTARTFRQIEVELDEGDVELIEDLSTVLRAAGARRRDGDSKLRLALGDRVPATAAPPWAPTTPAQLAAAAVADGRRRMGAHDIGLRLDDEAEDVHQARVACRRLRSDLRTFGPLLDADWTARMTGELRWLGDVLGAVRDLDVLDRRIAGRAHASGPRQDGGSEDGRLENGAWEGDGWEADGFAAIAVRLRERRAVARAALRDALDSRRYVALLDDLDAAARALPLGPSDDDPDPHGPATGVGQLVRRPWKRLRRAVRALPPSPGDADLHRVRIRAKALRYGAEAATPVAGRPARRLARAAAALQEELGDHHDAVVAEEALRRLAPTVGRSAAFVAGWCVAAEQREQAARRASWRAAWDLLDDPRLRRWLDD